MSPHIRGRWKTARSSDQDPAPAPRRRRSPRRWRLWILAGLLLVVAILWFLPAIVAHSPLLGWMVGRATAELDGSVSIGSASLGWLSPVELGAVELRDANEQPILHAEKVSTTRPLAELLLNWAELGEIRVEKPHLKLLARDDGSNLEDLLAEYLKREPSEYRPAFRLKITDGTIALVDQSTGRSWRIEGLSLLVVRPYGVGQPWQIEAEARAGPQRASVTALGKLRLAARWQPPAAAGDTQSGSSSRAKPHLADRAAQQPSAAPQEVPAQVSSGASEAEPPVAALATEESGRPANHADRPPRVEAQLDAEQLPLELLRPLLARAIEGARISGTLSGKLQMRWPQEPSNSCSADAQLQVADFVLGAAALGDDRIELPSFVGRLRMEGSSEVVRLAGANLKCELGQLNARGTIRPETFLSDRRWWEKLIDQQLELTGRIDLAELAAELPHTLRIRKDTQITGGELAFQFISRPEGPSPGWEGQVTATGLSAEHAGRTLKWEKPLQISFAGRRTESSLVLDDLLWVSDFLQARGAGNLKEAAVSATFDLDKLAAQLGQFIDLGQTQMAGRGWAHLSWTHRPEGQTTAEAELQIRQLDIRCGTRSLVEPELVAFASAELQTDPRSSAQLRSLSLEARAQGDLLKAWLIEPRARLSADAPWKWRVELRSNLARWPLRLAGWWKAEYGTLQGTGELAGRLIVGPEQMRLEQSTLRLAALRWDRGPLHLAEPQVDLAFSAAWHRTERRLRLEALQLTSATADLQADRLTVRLPKNAWPGIEGVVNYRIDTARLARWWAHPRTPAAWQTAGRLTGNASLAPGTQGTGVVAEADLTNLKLTHRSGFKWEEPLLHADLRGVYQPEARVLEIESLRLAAASLAAQALGRLSAVEPAAETSGQPSSPGGAESTASAAPPLLLALDGRLGYDWARLTPLLQAGLGPGVSIHGQFTSPATWQGPLDLASAKADAELQWERADLYGFQVGPGTCRAHLADGLLAIDPLVLNVNQGRLHLAPKVLFEPQPAVFTLPAGPLVERVQVTPQMCAAALQYVAPVLADATSVQGSFSIELDGCRIPLERPALGRMSGRMTIHSMEIGPGPLIRELAVALGRATPGRLRRESVIRFVMADGGVHHDGLELEFPDVTVRTRGFVGFDRSLRLVVELPIPEKWLVGPRVRAALANQTLTLPLAGTLSRPRLDRQALREANRRVLREAARNAVENELLNQLNRLLAPPQ